MQQKFDKGFAYLLEVIGGYLTVHLGWRDILGKAPAAIPFSIGYFVSPAMQDKEILHSYVFAEHVSFKENLEGFASKARALPASNVTYKLILNGDLWAEILYTTTGAFTATTQPDARLDLVPGDELEFGVQDNPDTDAVCSITLLGGRPQ